MQHICYNQLTLTAPPHLLTQIMVMLLGTTHLNLESSYDLTLGFNVYEAIILAKTESQLTLQFQSHNDPPIVGYLQLLQIYPQICITANYLNEFGLFAGTINLPLANRSVRQNNSALTVSITVNESDMTDFANHIFELDW